MKRFLTVIMITTTLAACSSVKDNPLITSADTPFDTPEFSKIQLKDYIPALRYAIKDAHREIKAITDNPEEPTFENTVEALERSGQMVNKIVAIFHNLNEAETSDEMDKIALKIEPMVVKYQNDITLDAKLFARIKKVWEQRSALLLDNEQQMLLEKTYKNFVRSGAGLDETQKEEYRKISTELSKLTLKFGQNTLAATNAFTINIPESDSAKIAELPDFVKEAMAMEAKNRNEKGWTVTLQYASMLPFMTYSTDRDLKKQLWTAYNTRCVGGKFDNTENIRRITDLRLQMAKLLGYKTYADYVLEERMAGTRGSVDTLLNQLLTATKPYAVAEVDTIQQYARKSGLYGADFKLMPWDWAYFTEKYKNEHFNLKEEEIKPYLELEHVKKGIFALADSLYGLKFTERKDIDVYNPDVKAYEVTDGQGKFVGVLYMDFFPRTSKKGGAWMTSFREMYTTADGKQVRPLVSMCGNFTKPTASAPSLLTFDEFETFLHEFGHCLHGLLAQGRYASLTGTNVYRDFVELPSQIMENWATEPEFLNLVAVNYKTGEPMPKEMIDNITASKNYLAAYANVRQLSFGLADMAYHSITEPIKGSIEEFEHNAIAQTAVMPTIEGTAFSPSFTHIFSGGYAAGYYGYKWAEVLEADAFTMFKTEGIFNKSVAESFRYNILSRGGSENPMLLYVNFRGHRPDVTALIEKMGIKPKQ